MLKALMAVVAVATVLLGVWPTPAHAGAAVDAALALGAFAVFSQLFLLPALALSQPVYAAAPPPVVYTPPPAVYATAPAPTGAPPLVKREVVYAHGRHVLLGDGVTSPYRWVWVPNPPAGAPPAPPR
jgi:hypothetical protein